MATSADRAATDRAELKRLRRGRSRTGLTAIRIAEINRLLTARHGERLPDTADTRRAIVVVAHHLAALPADPRRTIPSWIELRAPWYPIGDVKALLLEVIGKPLRYKAHTLAWQLKLTLLDRQALGIKTIGAIDATPAERSKARTEANRLAKMQKRRKQGAKPRAQYLAQVRKPQPWKALGMSRRTWYRKRQPQP